MADDERRTIEEEKKKKQMEIEKKRAEVRARMEEASKAKKAKKGFMTPERKKKLRLLLRKKAAEELKKEQERKAAERRRIIEERCGHAKSLDGLNEAQIKVIIQDYHNHMHRIEGHKWDLEREVQRKHYEIADLNSQVNDLRGKFIKPTLKKVSKYENKFAKLQKKAAEFNFRNQLKVVKKKEFTLEEEDKEKKPDWSKKPGDEKKEDDEDTESEEPSVSEHQDDSKVDTESKVSESEEAHSVTEGDDTLSEMSIEDGVETAAKELTDVPPELPVDATSTEQAVTPQQPTEGGETKTEEGPVPAPVTAADGSIAVVEVSADSTPTEVVQTTEVTVQTSLIVEETVTTTVEQTVVEKMTTVETSNTEQQASATLETLTPISTPEVPPASIPVETNAQAV